MSGSSSGISCDSSAPEPDCNRLNRLSAEALFISAAPCAESKNEPESR